MAMPGRSIGSYRYAHNGQEKDNEIFDGALSAEFWEYDARIGRRWEQDPVPNVAISPYACFGNNPILISDPNGDVVPPIVSALVFGSLKALYSFSTQFTSIYGESLASWAWHKVFKRDAGGPPNLKTSFRAALNQIDYADVASAFVVGAIEGFFPLKGLAIGIIELVQSAFNAAVDYTLGDEKGHRYRDKRRRFNTVFNTVEHKTLGEFAREFFVDLIGKAVTVGMTAFEFRKESFKVIMNEVRKKLFPSEILTGPELFKDNLREFFRKELGKGLGGAGGGGIFKFIKNKFKEWNKHRKEHKAKYKGITKKKNKRNGNWWSRHFGKDRPKHLRRGSGKFRRNQRT